MNKEEYIKFEALVIEYLKLYPQWRLGQTIFNVGAITLPDIFEPTRSSAYDPFYLDERIPVLFGRILSDEALQLYYQNPKFE